MLIDITLPVTPKMMNTALENTAKNLVGHVGTHFDVMDKEFPLAYTKRKGVVFNVSHVRDREIDLCDVDLTMVELDMCVAFSTDFLSREPYGTPEYFKNHPQLSHQLIDALLTKRISIIGIDCAGIRSGKEHVPTDQKCADHGVFVIENLWNLQTVLKAGASFTAHIYPLRYSGVTGLPCRVIAEVE